MSVPRVPTISLLCLVLSIVPALSFDNADIEETLDSVTITSDQFIVSSDGSSGRADIEVEAEVTFNLGLGVANATGSYVVGFQLLDEDDNEVAMSGPLVQQFDFDNGNQTVQVTAMRSGTIQVTDPVNQQETFTAKILPDAPLNHVKEYRVRAIIMQFCPDPNNLPNLHVTPLQVPDNGGFKPFSLDSAAQTFYHFDSTDPDDSDKNVFAKVNSATFSQRFRVATDDNHNKFKVDIDFDVFRYDAYNAAASPTDVGFTAVIQLFNQLDQPKGGGVVNFTRSIQTHGGVDLPPLIFQDTLQQTLEFTPNEQLDSVNDVFTAQVALTHNGGQFPESAGGATTDPAELLDFNGTLKFAEILTTMTHVSNDPTIGSVHTGSAIEVFLNVDNGFLNGFPNHLIGTVPAIGAELLANGDADVFSGSTPLFSPEDPEIEWDNHEGVRFGRKAGITLNSGGMMGEVQVQLPAGMGVTQTLHSKLLEPFLECEEVSLNQSLLPKVDLVTKATYYVSEESKPISINAGPITWEMANGKFSWDTVSVTYVRAVEMFALDNAPVNTIDREKKSNELYWRQAKRNNGNVAACVETGPNGEAQLSMELDFDAGGFTMHFPYKTVASYNGGHMVIEDDLIPSDGQSFLTNVPGVRVEYAQNCLKSDCDDPVNYEGDVFLLPADMKLAFTRDGGLTAEGDLLVANDRHLAWGYIDALQNVNVEDRFVHKTEDFSTGSFLMAGTFIRGDQNSQTDDDGAGIILWSGFNSGVGNGIERPGSIAYSDDGLADYPGMNFRASVDGPLNAQSYVAATLFGPYELTNRCKYYVRNAGVTGIHEAFATENFPPPVTIYGYDIQLTSFGFSYISNENEQSRTAGSMSVPYPADFSLDFEELKLDCLGALKDAELSNPDEDLLLKYWLADFNANAMEFVSTDCDPGTANLALGVTAYCSHVPEPLHGIWGFEPSGNLLTKESGSEAGIDSRLALPNTVTFDGPNDVDYTVVPITDAYLNNFDDLPGNDPDTFGFMNFAGTMDVAFFKDLEVHIATGAGKEYPSADPVHVAGGWDGDGRVDSPCFDPDHRGYAPGVMLAEYRSGSADDSHRARAKVSWLDVVDFDFPLEWSGPARSFRSAEPIGKELLVLSTEQQVGYLSSHEAELSFGVVFEGLPKISLGNLVNAIDEQTGVLSALTDAVGEQVTGALQGGSDAFARLLDNRIDALLDDALMALLSDSALDQLRNALLQNAYNNVSQTFDGGDLGVELTAFEQTLSTGFPNLLGTIADGLSIVREIDDSLAEVQTGIRSVIDKVYKNGADELVIDPDDLAGLTEVPGILFKNGQGEFQLVQGLVYRLLEAIAPDIADNLVAALGGPLDELNEELNALLESAKPTIDQLIDTLQDLDNLIGTVREKLTGSGAVLGELEDIFAAANAEFQAIAGDIKAELTGYFNGMNPDLPGVLFHELSNEELRLHIRNVVKDHLFAGNFTSQIQTTLKQHLYDLNASIQQGVDSIFAQINRTIRDLLTEALGGLDEKINGFLGDIANVVGGAEVDGYAHIVGDSLKKLRLDLMLEMNVPDPMNFHGYVQVCELNSEGDTGCYDDVEKATEVTIGAEDIPVRWVGSDLRFNVGAKVTFGNVNNSLHLRGVGGHIEMTEGELNFEAFKVTQFAAGVMFGADENYLAARVGVIFDGYEMAGGIFFGRTCTLAPIELVDPDVAMVLGEPPFTGAYVYGEVYMPIVNYTCLFRVSAGVGAGAFYFAEGPTYGGKAKLAAGGEVLCLLRAKGEITLVGAKSGDSFSFLGKGRLQGSAGWCPVCIEFDRTYIATYKDEEWDVSRD